LAGDLPTETKNDSQAEVPEAEGSQAEEKNDSQAEGSLSEEKPVGKQEKAVEKSRDILATPKTKETAAVQALRKAQQRVRPLRKSIPTRFPLGRGVLVNALTIPPI
jgi:hypothetical protein